MQKTNEQSKDFSKKIMWVIEVLLRYAKNKNKNRFYVPKLELENKDKKITFNETVDIINKIKKEKDGLAKMIPHTMPLGPEKKSYIVESVMGLNYSKQEYKLKNQDWHEKYKDNLEIRIKDIDKLKKILDNLQQKQKIKELTEEKKAEKIGKNRIIKKITIIKMNGGKVLIAINDDYQETRTPKSYSEWWQTFIKEIEDRNIRPETRNNVRDISKAMKDYFNYNSKKCPIYMSGKYTLTEIFVGKDIDTKINPEVKTEIIKETSFFSRKNRKNKK